MSPKIIDSHVHIFPDPLAHWYEEGRTKVQPYLPLPHWSELRQLGRALMTGYTESLQSVQPMMRYLPESVRSTLDVVGTMGSLPGFLVESNVDDLKQRMQKNGVSQAVVVAHPPFAPNELVLKAAHQDPSLIPCVYIPTETNKPAQALKRLVEEEGARALKIHTAADGEAPSAPRYRALLKAAGDLGIPVIIHTGCVHTGFIYKKPELASVELFVPWFKNYPQQKFLLSHMNFHSPDQAIELCEKYPSLYVDTSWQPAEVIGEAVRRIGPERVLFASDWPIMGRNMDVAIRRINDAVSSGFIQQSDADLILGENAIQFFKLAAI